MYGRMRRESGRVGEWLGWEGGMEGERNGGGREDAPESCSRSAKYLLESETGSTAIPGNISTGHTANSSPASMRERESDTSNLIITAESGPHVL